MRVFLIHGMGRSRASLLLLARRLQKLGHTPSTFGYMVTREPLDDIGARFIAHIEAVRDADAAAGAPADAPYAIVGHSLGNIITRLSTDALPCALARFIMLAPPNQPPVMADRLKQNPVFRMLTQDAGQRLADPGFYATLARPDVPTLIINGDAGPRAAWLPFAGAPNDGVVAVAETELDGVEAETFPAIHTLIMNRADVTARIDRFLQHGTDTPAADTNTNSTGAPHPLPTAESA